MIGRRTRHHTGGSMTIASTALLRGALAIWLVAGGGKELYRVAEGFLVQGWLNRLFMVAMAILNVVAVVAGVRLWRSQPDSHRWAARVFAAQIPIVELTAVSYAWYYFFVALVAWRFAGDGAFHM